MSSFHNNALVGASGQRGYQIERSLRFNSADSAYLSKTPTTPTNNLKWTFSCWVKRSALGANSALFDAYLNGTNFSTFYFTSTNELQFYNILGGVDTGVTTTGVYRDLSAWYHIVFVFDSANATAADRAIIYVNGTRPAQTNPYGAVTSSEATYLNNSYAHSIGRMVDSGTYLNGYLTETYLIDGQALTPSSFGETDTITGVWKPKKYAGTYGTNGFYLKFADNSGTTSTTLGKDSSGNGNNWTPNNFSVTAGAGNDSMIDTPTPYADGGNGRGNYCTLNPLEGVNSAGTNLGTFANGNLEYSVAASTGNAPRMLAFSTIHFPTSGKWYAEFTNISNRAVGLLFGSVNQVGLPLIKYISVGSSNYYSNDGSVTSGAAVALITTDIVGVTYDVNAATIKFYKNGTEFLAFGSVTTSIDYCFGSHHESSASAGTVIANFGQRPFAYTPPSGFLALNTQNLPEPTIKKPSSYFNAVTYTGSASSVSVTGVGFQPDFIWTKARSTTFSHGLMDAVRGVGSGATKILFTNNTNAEATQSNILSIDSDGFTTGTSSVGETNNPGTTYVAWCWDESATPGFDIVTYTGTGSARTIAHSLGVAPQFIIVKNRSNGTANWQTGSAYHNATSPWNYYMRLNTTAAAVAASTIWNNTAPTSSVFSVGTDGEVNANGDNYVAYLWSEVAGFSKFGSYTGNGSSDGPFVACNFRPRWVMVKRINATENWAINDSSRSPTNPADAFLRPDESSADSSLAVTMDLLSNGFKLRTTDTKSNASGSTYIFAAFAESPFKYSLAR